MKAPVVRRATLRDLALLVRHRRRMWEEIGGFTEEQLAAADPVYRGWARTRLRSGALVGWVVTADGAAAATGCIWIQPVQPNPRWPKGLQPYLLSMFTESEHRGRGFAKTIVEAATAVPAPGLSARSAPRVGCGTSGLRRAGLAAHVGDEDRPQRLSAFIPASE